MIIRDKTQKGTLPDDELDELLEFLEKEHWRDAFEKLDLPVLQTKKDWFTNLNRANYYNNLSLKNKETVLDIGAGAGVISQALCKTFKRVYSLEYNSKWVRFLSRRFKQDQNNNINLLRANAVEFPFKPNSFNLVVVNGVLEWVADFSVKNSPFQTQLGFLKDINKLIIPGGKIGIAIENRFYMRWFLGETPHGEPPYTVFMPRSIANFICKRKLNKEYRNYIYGYWGYKKILKKAGFKNIEIKLAVPNYYNPVFIVGLTRKSQRKYFNEFSIRTSENKYLRKITKFLLFLGLLGYFEHSFYICAEK